MASSRWVLISARQFGSSAVHHSSLVKPPVPLFGIEGRYATALYSAAVKQKKLDNVEKDLNSLKALLKQDVKFMEFVANPLVKPGTKRSTLETALTKKNYSTPTVNLVGLMAENGRLRNLNSVIDSFIGIMGTLRGEVLCKIVSAKPLDAPLLKELETTLAGFVKKEEKILLQTKVDPSLLGGLVVSIGDKYIDMSLAKKIKTYTDILMQVV